MNPKVCYCVSALIQFLLCYQDLDEVLNFCIPGGNESIVKHE